MFGVPYLMTHVWPRLFAFGTGGALVYWLAWLRERKAMRRDLLYFIPMQVWAFVLLAMGICWSFLPAPSTVIAAREITGTQTSETVAKPNPGPVKIAPANGLQLQGILYSSNGHTSAIINNKTVFVGGKVGDFTVNAIEPKRVSLQAADGKETVLRISDSR